MRVPALISIAVLFGHQALSQRAATEPSFEVASVRPHSPQDKGGTGTEGGPGTNDPEHYAGRGMPLRTFLCIAFATADCQQQISGPGWIDSEEYDLAANIPPGTTKEQFAKMLQNLLVERFQLVLHHETKILAIYELVVAKNGPKLKESVEAAGGDRSTAGPPSKVEHDADGFPMLPPGRPTLIASFGPGSIAHWAAQQQTMSMLASRLGMGGMLAAGRQVIDKTGLSGKYDFRLVYDMRLPGVPASDDTAAPILGDALEQQLGLKLAPSRAPFDFVIIDRGEKAPLEN